MSITASAGVAIAGEHGDAATALLKRAEIVLYRAKADGEGKFQIFAPDMERAVAERLVLKRALAEALPKRQLELDYQPIIDLKTGRVGSAEALLRWRHPERGRIPPAEFIPIAERTGLIAPIGAWVLEEACRAACYWPGRPSVAVNVSAAQFAASFPTVVEAILDRTRLDPARLVIEITESVLVQDTEENLAVLNSLKRLGVKIALDDFGTGYSSLAYLSRFPFDVLKMDRGFIGDNAIGKKSLAVVRAVAQLAYMLGMRVTAEGVETEEQLARVKQDGCDFAQGYLFGRPLRQDDLIAMLAERMRPAPALAVAETARPQKYGQREGRWL
jgi:EAL domain-containing protein (putative c-di-GMP-specific phosphodiesterase class I)